MATRELVRALFAAWLLGCGGDAAPAVRAAPKPAPKPAAPADELACVQIVFFQHNGGEPCADCVEQLPAEAERKAHQAQARLDQGADFTELAKTAGTAPLGDAKDGVLGTFLRSKWPEQIGAIRDAVFALKVGEHTKQPLKIEFAFVLVRRCETGTPKDEAPATPQP